jgi:RNA polymerase sigma factor (sigma-70 family)
MTSDLDLLRQFARENSQDAFTEIVRRHVNLVYSAALRQVRSPQLAEEIAQSVFADLARAAKKLNSETILTAWLYSVARRTAIDAIRKESRRQLREQIAVEMNNMNATANNWTQIEPLLDDAMAALDETDRSAILLRYFENKNLHEVGEALGTSDDAAQKRVSRAVEKLREFFSKQKITVGASGLAVLISTNAVQAAPVGLAATISAAVVLAGTAVKTSTVIAATKTIAMTTLQKSIIGATLAAAIGTGIFEAHQASQLREQNQILQQQQTSSGDQIQQLRQELNDTTNQLVGLWSENGQLQSNPNEAELLKLRGEVGQLQQELKDLPATRVALLKQKLGEMPDKKIPELKFLTEKDWLNAAWNADLETDDGVRLALSKLRDEAVDTFLNLTRTALKKYLAANNNLLPADLLPLKPYFDTPVTDEMLQRYAFMQTGQLSSNPSDSVVRKAVYADEDYDSNQEMSMSGGGGGSFNRNHDAIYDAAVAFATDNNGQLPSDPSQIASYLKRSIDDATIQKYFGQITTDIAANPPSPEKIAIAPAVKAYTAANNGQHPKKPSDLLPYTTTPEQQAAVQKLEQQFEQHNSVLK